MMDLESFRAETRDWLEANCPAEMRTPIKHDDDVCWGGRNAKLRESQRLWLDRMGARGWTVPEWPAAYGVSRVIVENYREPDRQIGF